MFQIIPKPKKDGGFAIANWMVSKNIALDRKTNGNRYFLWNHINSNDRKLVPLLVSMTLFFCPWPNQKDFDFLTLLWHIIQIFFSNFKLTE